MPGIDLRRWRWLESGLIPLASAVMRTAWLTPLMYLLLNNVFVAPSGVPYPGWLILVLLLGASALNGLVQEHPNAPAIMAGAGLLAVLLVLGYAFQFDASHPGRWLLRLLANLTDFRLAFPASLVVILATALLWRKGMTVVWDNYLELFKGFLTGVIALGAMLLLVSSATWEASGLNLWGLLLTFVFAALLSLATISAHQTLEVERLKDARVPPLSRQWLMVVGSVILAVILVGWVAAELLSPDAVQQLLRLLRPVWVAIRTAISYVILAIAYVVFWLLGPLLELVQSSMADNWDQATKELGERLEEEMELPEPAPTAGLPPALLLALRILGITLLVVGIAWLLYRAYRKRSRKARSKVLEQRESVLTTDLLAQQLRDLLASLRRKPAVSPFVPVAGEDPRVVIRRLYQQMLQRLSARGRARPPEVTPRAYARSVADLLPAGSEALTILTEAYLVARYAPDPPTWQQVAEASAAWEQIAAQLGG